MLVNVSIQHRQEKEFVGKLCMLFKSLDNDN